jgi:hypothetical protein
MSAAASYSPRTPGTSVVRNLPDVRNVHLERGFQFALYRRLARCHAARRDVNDERILWATALGSNAEQWLIQPAEIRPGRGG